MKLALLLFRKPISIPSPLSVTHPMETGSPQLPPTEQSRSTNLTPRLSKKLSKATTIIFSRLRGVRTPPLLPRRESTVSTNSGIRKQAKKPNLKVVSPPKLPASRSSVTATNSSPHLQRSSKPITKASPVLPKPFCPPPRLPTAPLSLLPATPELSKSGPLTTEKRSTLFPNKPWIGDHSADNRRRTGWWSEAVTARKLLSA